MKRRVRASSKTRKALEDLFSGCGGAASERSDLVKLARRLIVEEALEGEVDDQLGRGYYAHGAQAGHYHSVVVSGSATHTRALMR